MSDRERRHDEILGANVVMTGWTEGREADVAETLDLFANDPVDLATIDLPYVVLAKATIDKAERARGALEASGAIVETQDALGHKNPSTTRVYVRRIAVKRDKHSEDIARLFGLSNSE